MLWVLKRVEIGKLRTKYLISYFPQWEVGNVSRLVFFFKLYFNELQVRSPTSKESRDDSQPRT